ncbi:MAG TPA: hypothetical protein VF283_13470 [Bryobacteraceae bacterium]
MKIVRFLRLLSLGVIACSVFCASHRNRQQLRQQIETTLHISVPLPAPHGKSYVPFTPAPGVAADRVSYATAYGMRVPAIVYHQAGATIERHPALIVVNRPSDDKSSWYDSWAGILYAGAGAVVLTYDPIGEYERNKDRLSGAVQYSWSGAMGRRLAGLMVSDILQAANYLSHRSDVDPKRIAVLGSSGSFAALLACAVDTQVRACMLGGGSELFATLDKQAAAQLSSSKNVLNYSGRQPYFLSKPAALWLEKKLKFRNWTGKKIQAMPETQKAGTTVLGANIPSVPRDELYAVPKVVWQFQKNNYTYESWLARAKAAIAHGQGATANAH